jgi:DNA segregation ATPase FtsK/SpoIIIE, S-DNA-T family
LAALAPFRRRSVPVTTTSTTATRTAGTEPPAFLVHRPVRAHPRPLPVADLTLAAPPTVGWAPSGLAGWLPYLVPLAGSGGSVAFLLAMPGPRPTWLVVLAVAAAVASVAAGLVLRLAEGRATRRARRRERARYLAHLARMAVLADQLAAAQLATAEHYHPDPPELWTAVARTDRLWERRPGDADFLTVRIGRGPVPLAAPVRLDSPPDPLADHDPELLRAARRLVRRATWLPGAPVPIDLRELGVVAITGPADRTRALARAIVCQLAAFHAPEDLRVLAAYPPAAGPAWQWLRRLPHTRDPTVGDGPVPGRLLAEDQGQLDAHLTRELGGRRGVLPGGGSPGERSHLVAVVDANEPPVSADPPAPGPAPSTRGTVQGTTRGTSPGTTRGTFRATIVEALLDRPPVAGVTVVWLARTISGEPSELAARVRLDEHGSATVQETAPGGRLLAGVRADAAGVTLAETIARHLAPRALDRPPAPAAHPGPVRLLDLLDPEATRAGSGAGPAGSGAGARAGGRWRLLRVPIGVTATGGPLMLDLKEAAEAGIGPHGLVVGATGSGKSELLRTIVAGLAATHAPEQLAFVLVDFKGGAAFADLASLPQVAGLITNLHADLSMVDRAMAALQGELTRRQRLLHQAGNQPDLRAYAARRATDPRLEPLPHLLLVVDEFGELLAARPEFLDLFTAVGRVGRSVGMHLLLASQRLDEGRLRGLDSHLRFRICLRTFSAAESTAVLGVPDAYHLPPFPGAALLKVDAAPPVPFTAALVSSDQPDGSRDRPEIAQGPPHVSPERPDAGAGPHGVAAGPGSDLEVLRRLAERGPAVHQVWLPPLSADVALDRLLATGPTGWLRVPVGLVDRPLDQDQEPLVLDLSGGAGHLVVCGAPRTGKSTLLSTVVAALAATHPPDEVQVYAVDLGGGLLHRLGDLPHVGAVCGPRDAARVRRLVRELRSLILERERRFRDLDVDSMASWHALRRAGLDLGGYGEVFLVVDNWGALVRELPELEPEITELAALGLHYGVHLALSANRWAELRPGLRESLGGRLELRLNDPLESELGRALAAALPDVPGRGLTASGLQFQVALPGEPRAVLDRALAGRSGAVAPPLRLLPTLVGEAAVGEAAVGEAAVGEAAVGDAALSPPDRGGPAGLPFAVEEHRLEVARLDLLAGSPHLLVLGDAGCGKSSLLRLLAGGLAVRHPPGEVALLVVDLRRGLVDLTALPNLAGYACTTAGVTQAIDHLRRELEDRMASGLVGSPAAGAGSNGHGSVVARSALKAAGRTERFGAPFVPEEATHAGDRPSAGAWVGPRYVVLVDDYDLLPGVAGSPLLPLLDVLGLGRELGVHLVLARRVAGVARAAFEPVFQRLRELGGPGLIMDGDPGEGPVLAGQHAAALPPGRGLFVDPPRPPALVQVAYRPPPAPPQPAAPG